MAKPNRVRDEHTIYLDMPFTRQALVEAVLSAKIVPKDVLELQAGRSTTVLIAEDNKVNQKLAKWHLERLGCNVKLATSGYECLDLWQRQPFDLILMDVQMPEMSGLDACREIRRLEKGSRHTPIVALTASALDEDRERCLQAGMDDFIPKPFREQDLKRVLALHVVQQEQEPEAAGV